ncbi:hypothetical protein D9619_000245 [Psilocybe cf. subviscida]|uniref:Uncharacterized protein n=1 Tax=Psilocybe cf. subviscida TaxID=2480587 RepID=A0A8H5F3W5_9AGAR|nr:hypothetical protein D9619_000245 [Psilocybe cf. subviscida]
MLLASTTLKRTSGPFISLSTLSIAFSPSLAFLYPSELLRSTQRQASSQATAHNTSHTTQKAQQKHIFKNKSNKQKMAKKKGSSTPHETTLLMPAPPTTLPIVDTHTHVASTYEAYVARYKSKREEGQGQWIDPADSKEMGPSPYTFLRAMFAERNVEALVDVWCEAPVRKEWRAFADAALALSSTPRDAASIETRDSRWKGVTEYWFVLGVHPHEAKSYTPAVEQDIITALSHPRNVGLGEIGLDYHYTLSPPDVQQHVFETQLKLAIANNKPITVHTREAEDDTERILKKVVPKEWKIHVHCFTDSPAFAQRLQEWFPNLYIGITGVITYTTNTNTADAIRDMVRGAADPSPPSNSSLTSGKSPLRILLETDAPYMVPSNLYGSLPAWNPNTDDKEQDKKDSKEMSRKKLALCHTGMLPWTAEFVAEVVNSVIKEHSSTETKEGEESEQEKPGEEEKTSGGVRLWTADDVMCVARENARTMYGV